MAVAAIAGLIALIVAGVILGRGTSGRKKVAIASLQEEQKAVGVYSILDMVDTEVADLNLTSIQGSDGLSPDLLLKAWAEADDIRDCCDFADLKFIVVAGVTRSEATPNDVELVCTEPVAQPPVEPAPDDAGVPPPGSDLD